MNSVSNNATPPTPAIAPGAEAIDVRRAAERQATRFEGGMDPRVRAIVPGFDAPFFQAGLAGYSDAAMRLIARREGCPFCVTEALLDRTLLAGGRGFTKADLGELHENVPGGPDDHPLACQIMGSEAREMAAAAVKVAEQGRRGDRHYRMLAYAGLSDEERAEVEGVHLRLPGGGQVGRVKVEDDATEFDPTEGCRDEREVADGGWEETCETTVDEINRAPDEIRRSMSDAREDQDRATRGSMIAARQPPDIGPALSFETIDVNLACPVKKVRSKARGGHWLAEPEGAIRILEAVREAVPREIPCTVKLRRSYDDTPEMAANFERIFEAALSMGYAWATVHARTVEQKYIGPSRWTFLRDLVRRYPNAIVFGSGDIWEVGDIFRMIEYTGVVGVAVARGCIGNPWIFRQARELLAGRAPSAPTIAEQRRVLEDHYRLLLRVVGGAGGAEREDHPKVQSIVGKQMRKFGIRFAAHHPRGEEVRLRFIGVNSVGDWMRVLDEWYAA